MGLIGSFFGLIFSGGYTAHVLSSEKEANKKYEAKVEAAHQSMCDFSVLLKDYELERLVTEFVSKPVNNAKIKKLLSTELEYISKGDSGVVDWMFGDENVQFTNRQKIDLLMSKFGKMSSSTINGYSRFGTLVKITDSTNMYDESVRVLQCIESNLKHTTSRMVLFGVNPTATVVNGKYSYAHIVIIGTIINKALRVYNSYDIAFSEITKEDLENA